MHRCAAVCPYVPRCPGGAPELLGSFWEAPGKPLEGFREGSARVPQLCKGSVRVPRGFEVPRGFRRGSAVARRFRRFRGGSARTQAYNPPNNPWQICSKQSLADLIETVLGRFAQNGPEHICSRQSLKELIGKNPWQICFFALVDLQMWFCNCGFATLVLQLLFCNCGFAIVNCGIAVVVLQSWVCRHRQLLAN